MSTSVRAKMKGASAILATSVVLALGAGAHATAAEPADPAGTPVASTPVGAVAAEETKVEDELIAAIRAYAEGRPEFAGIYHDVGADPERLGTIVVRFVGDTEAHSKALRSSHPAAASHLRVETARSSRAMLLAAADRVATRMPLWRATGKVVSGVGPDYRSNKLVVTLERDDPALVEQVRAVAADVEVVFEAGQSEVALNGDRNDAHQPLKGGLRIVSQLRGNACSSGFMTHNNKAGLDRRWYVLTAGHCFEVGDAVDQGGIGRGFVTSSAFHNGTSSTSDSEVVELLNQVDAGNQVYISFGRYNTVTTSRDAVQGDRNCKSGYRTQYTCGTVERTDYTVYYSSVGVTLHGTHIMLAGVNDGDSGGSVLSSTGTVAVGIVSGKQCPCSTSGFSERLIYSPVNNALSIHRVRLGK